ncbi:hypothetical protein BHE74_00024094 [Ensete ventricosum]|nr:hypothetical protein BHE74_00024094 [Ensete ventricosum]
MLKFPFGCAGVKLKCIGASMGEKQPLTKKLPPTTTVNIPLDPQYHSNFIALIFVEQVSKLKVLCESFFKLKDIRLRLYIQEEVLVLFYLHSNILFYHVAVSVPTMWHVSATWRLCLRPRIIGACVLVVTFP